MTTNELTQKKTALPATALDADAMPVSSEKANARLMTEGAFPSSMIVNSYFKTTTTDPCAMLATLQEQAQAIQQGDMTQVESMLINQAVALQTMFVDLALRAKTAQSLQAVQCLTQLALRSQAGSRNTLLALAEVKNPRQVAFVRQTNVAQTQQVNNGVPPPSHGKKAKATPNELLVEQPYGSTKMDIRTKAKAGRVDPAVVAMDRVDRPTKRQG